MSTTESRDEEVVVDPNAVNITINGRTVSATKGEMIIAAADRTADFIPRFCYHPRMKPVGMCRQCLVEVEGPRGPMMVVSCMTPVADGQVVRTDTEQVKKAQEGVLELLLANHPLDCPVCDKGGECPLQDQAFSHGPGESRYVEEKRHYEKPIPISDLVFLDRERCILCDRCTRFAKEVAGDPLISFTHRGNNTQVLTFPDEPFASYFSGNTVQICPVGALTAQPYRFKARPWDLEERESTCTTCSVGCRIAVQSSRDELVRYQGVDSDPVNWGWLCDRGRFNFQSASSDDRITTPHVRDGQLLAETTWVDALTRAAQLISAANGKVALVGGARGTNEDAWAWAQLADLAKFSMRDAQVGDGLPAKVFTYPQATIDSACSAPTIILLSPDLKEELPVLYLRVRDAVEKGRSRVVEITSHDSGLTKYAWKSIHHEPGHQVEAVRAALTDADIAAQLAKGPVVIIAGRSSLAESEAHIMSALDVIVGSVANVSVLPALRRGNVRGALTVGLAPTDGNDATQILKAAVSGEVECLVLLGSDPLSDHPDADLVRRAFASVRSIVAIDMFMNQSVQSASVVLPAAAFGEKNGSTTNLEGRVTNVSQKVTPRGTSRPDWMIAIELAHALGYDIPLTRVEEVQAHMIASIPQMQTENVTVALRRNGIVVPTTAAASATPASTSVGTRNSYEFRLVTGRKLYDKAISTATSQSLVNLAENAAVYVHPLDLERVGKPEGASVRVSSSSGAIALPVRASTAVVRGTAFVPFNLAGADVRELIRYDQVVTDVRIEGIS
ncbi:MAG: NADH-quinone oxidoreductase subunit NuoG [Ilumatobacteraceae bacterium]|nr:NADH-quinone oxidoreductase subunit NuoG [Ilumatobacteraceae bacterium]